MAEPRRPTTASPQPGQPTWSPELRTWVSLLLFAHLFALVVAVTTYTRPSGLQVRLHNLFEPYLRNLHMTVYPVSYPFARYYLAHATPNDFDYSVEVEFQGSAGPETVTIPRDHLQPLVRYRRYQALANAMGVLSQPEGNEDLAGILPKAIAAAVLKQHGAQQGTLRCRPNHLPIQEALRQLNEGRRETFEEPGKYEAQVFVTPSGVELLKKNATLEVAPVERASKTPSGKKVPSSPTPR